jgi:hypothetical protein
LHVTILATTLINTNNNKKKYLEVLASTEVVDFTEKFERKFSLMTGISSSGSAKFRDIGVWYVDSGAYRHMMRMRSSFLNFSKIDSDCYVVCGASTRVVLKGLDA